MSGGLEKLAAQADGMGAAPGDGQPEAAPGVEPGAQVESLAERNTRGICTLLAMAREATASKLIFNPPLATLKLRLTDEVLPGLAGPWGQVLAHYGIDMLGKFDHPVAVALVATAWPLWSIASELRTELAQRRPVDVESKPVPEAAGLGDAG